MNLRTKTLLVLLVTFGVAASFASAGGSGSSNAANKTSAAGSTVEILGSSITGGAGSTSKTVLSTTIKTSPPMDLIFSVTMECALWTTVRNVGNDVAESTSRVTVTVLIDGVEVRVSPDDPDGSVVFCDRTHRQTTADVDDEDAAIEQYLATRTANGFNWVLPDVGGGTHRIEVVAELSGQATDNAVTQAGVGHRTLIVEPTHMAQGATIESGTDAAASTAKPSNGSKWSWLWPF